MLNKDLFLSRILKNNFVEKKDNFVFAFLPIIIIIHFINYPNKHYNRIEKNGKWMEKEDT